MIFCQITKNFDEVVALASAPRPDQPYRIHFVFDDDESSLAMDLYDRHSVVDILEYRYLKPITHLTYSDMLYVFVAIFQNQPLSMEFYAMKRVLADDLVLKKLPEGLKL